MSSFTKNIKMMAVAKRRTGWRRLLPPGFIRPAWEVAERFEYAVGSLNNPSHIITVPEGFIFDGASVPMIFWPLFPMAHPNYIQAAALHDNLYSRQGDYNPMGIGWIESDDDFLTRRDVDDIFHEALGVLGMAAHWRFCFWIAVRIGGRSAWNRDAL